MPEINNLLYINDKIKQISKALPNWNGFLYKIIKAHQMKEYFFSGTIYKYNFPK